MPVPWGDASVSGRTSAGQTPAAVIILVEIVAQGVGD